MLVKNRYEVKFAEIFFLITYFVFAFIKVIYHTKFDTPWMDSAINIVCILLAFLFILDRRWREKAWWIKVAIAIVFSISAHTTNRPFVMAYGLLIMCADVTTFRRIVSVSMAATFLAVSVTVAACLLGKLPNKEKVISDGIIGYALGFNGRTGVPFHLFYVFLSYLYLRKGKLPWAELLFWAGVNYLINRVAQVRLVYYLWYVVLIMYILVAKYEYILFKKGVMCNIVTLSFPVVCTIWAFINKYHTGKNPIMAKLNVWLSYRLDLAAWAFREIDIKLFGQYIKMGNIFTWKKVYFYIDSGFLYSLLGYGLLFTIVVLIMYSLISRYAFSTNQRVLAVWACAVLIFSLVNNTWVDVGFNPLLMACPILLNRGSLEE